MGIKHSLSNLYLKQKNRGKCNFGKKVSLNRKVFFEGNNFLGNNTVFESSRLGYSSYVSFGSLIKYCWIGKFSSIASNVRIIIGNHPTTYGSTHPCMYSKMKEFKVSFAEKFFFESIPFLEKDGQKYSVIIGNDVWIGENVSILNGVKIGDGAIVGANAFVNKDIEPYSVVVGVPAKTIRKRFDDQSIKQLLETKWWNFSEPNLRIIAQYIDDPQRFIFESKRIKDNGKKEIY